MNEKKSQREIPSLTDDEAGQPSGAGYGKPPPKHRFQPGQSGNPNGRPKVKPTFSSLISQIMEEKITIPKAGGTKKITCGEGIVRAMFAQALKGDVKAGEFLWKHRHDAASLDAPVAFSKEDESLLARYAREFADRLETDADDDAAVDHHGASVP